MRMTAADVNALVALKIRPRRKIDWKAIAADSIFATAKLVRAGNSLKAFWPGRFGSMLEPIIWEGLNQRLLLSQDNPSGMCKVVQETRSPDGYRIKLEGVY